MKKSTILCPAALGVFILATACTSRSGDPNDDNGDNDGPAQCSSLSQCEPRVCEVVASCYIIDDEVSCSYEDAASDVLCDLPDSPEGSQDGVCNSGLCFDRGVVDCTANDDCGQVRRCVAGNCQQPGDLGDSCDSGDAEDCAGDLLCGTDPAVCVQDLGESCSRNDECLGVCVAGVCAVAGDLGASCDSGEDADCAAPLACRGGDNICAQDLGASCSANTQCLATCIGGVCAAPAGLDGACDSGDLDDCASGFVCDPSSNTCLRAEGEGCAADAECSAQCIAGTCADASDLYGDCDVGDSADCQAPLVCNDASGTCLADLGASCTDNGDCDSTCIAGVCALPSDSAGLCDPWDDADCDTGLGCSGEGVCALANGSPCTDHAQCAGVCMVDTCAAPLADGAPCTVDEYCAAGKCNNGSCGTPGSRVFVFEVQGHYGSNCATISEIEFFEGGVLLDASVTTVDAYDTVMDGLPNNWTSSSWGGAKLVDGNANYFASSTMAIIHPSSTPSPDPWGRFAIFLPEDSAPDLITVHVGSIEDRIPYYVRAYRADLYDFDNQILGRSDEGLTLVGTITPDATWTAVRAEDINL